MTSEYKGSERDFPILRKVIDYNPQGTLDVLNLTLHRLEQEKAQRFIEILLKISKVNLVDLDWLFMSFMVYSFNLGQHQIQRSDSFVCWKTTSPIQLAVH